VLLIIVLGFLLIINLTALLTPLTVKYVVMCKGDKNCAIELTLSIIFATFAIIVICLVVIKAIRYKNERNAHTSVNYNALH
jgi:hypothetical protein